MRERIRADHGPLLEEFLSLEQVKGAKALLVFYGVGNEPDTRGLILTLLEAGKKVALPRCLAGGEMEARWVTGLAGLVPNRFGIPEPDDSCPVIGKHEIAAVLVPHLMVDRAGYRLGWGGGYYDRWLADFPGFTVCVCRPGRLVDHMPREEFDVPVQLVLIEE